MGGKFSKIYKGNFSVACFFQSVEITTVTPLPPSEFYINDLSALGAIDAENKFCATHVRRIGIAIFIAAVITLDLECNILILVSDYPTTGGFQLSATACKKRHN